MNTSALRFLLSGYYGFGNLGDEALLEVIISQLRTRFPYAVIDVLSHKPAETALSFGVEATPRMDLRAVNEAVGKADIVLSGGGGLLQNSTSIKSLFYYSGILNVAARHKKAVIFAQSIGPLDSLGRRIVAKLCRRVQLATVRDAKSLELLTQLLPELRIERTADPVFLYEPDPEHRPSVPLGVAGYAGPLALVSLRRSAQSDKVGKRVAQAVDQLAQRGIQTIFVPFAGAADAETATAVIRRCRAKPMLLPQTDLAGMYALLERCTVVIGMRLHALILAARVGVPFLALAYDPKVSALCEDLEYTLPSLWSIDPAVEILDPVELTNRLVDEHDALQVGLRAGAARMRVAAQRNFALLETL